jgi:hydrophobic/amphiphilic exporter-1 (mainly G- bacteria), HAE1 family
MSIYKQAVNKPITTLMIFAAVIVMGIYALSRIPVDLYPEINPPFISVITTYPGANAADIESIVTRPLEDALNAVDKLKEVTSTSSDNLSVITLEFSWEANLDEATNEIRDVIDRIYNFLPDDVDRPAVFKFSTAQMPIVFYAVTANESYPGLQKILDEKVINPLNRIDGIGSVGMMGTPKRMVYVDVDARRLDAYFMTIEQIGNVIAAENLNMPSGHIKMGKMDYQLRIQGEFVESNQLEKLVVGNFQGTPVYLSDVATVRDTLKDIMFDETINGQTGLRMFIMKQSGANTVSVARDVTNMVEELKKDLPPDIEISLIMDTSSFIKGSIANLSQTLMYAFLFVIVVVLFFLGKWRATFIIVLTIPISLIIAFVYLFISGNSVNVISLTSLSIAIGMVVDDAIVVLENITRHIERGSSPREAAIYATNEVWMSVIITTLVVVAVFFPLTLVGGLTGVMFNQLGWIVTITVITSTFAAISITPMLSSRLLVLKERTKKPRRFSYQNTIEKLLSNIEDFYVTTLRWVLKYRYVVLIAAGAVFISSFGLMRSIGTDFMPETDESRINMAIELQTGTRVEETIKTTRKIERLLMDDYPEIEVMAASSGSDDEGGMFALFTTSGSNMINFMTRLTAVDEREKSVWEISDELREKIGEMPEVISLEITTSGGPGMGGGSNAVDIEIFGYDFNTTNALAQKVRQKLLALENATDITISRKADKPELQVVLDKEKLALHGMSSAAVSAMVRNRISGFMPSRFKEEGDEYDILIRLTEEYRSSISDLEQMTIMSPRGEMVKLGEIATIEEFWSPPGIQHKRKERVVTVSAKPNNTSLGDLAGDILEMLEEVEVPRDVMINVGGAYQEQQEAFTDLGLLMILSLLLVFIVMASQFESFRMPFVIMFSIPFAFTGVIYALFITGTTLNVIAGLGAVLLIGIVVKNGIVLVDFINLMRDRGHPLREAILIAGKSRLRPVLMTAFTTILSMLPLALSTGEGSEIWSPMGITVIGGLVFSTVVTMVIVPVMYAIVSRSGQRNKTMHVRKKFSFLD